MIYTKANLIKRKSLKKPNKTKQKQNDKQNNKPQNPHTKNKTLRSFSFPIKTSMYFIILFSNLTYPKLQLKLPYSLGNEN